MTIDRQRRLRELFDAVVDLSPDQRSEFLERECGSDADLRTLVWALLASDARVGLEFDEPLFRTKLSAEKLAAGRTEFSDIAKAEASMGCALPKRVGRYRILDVLGSGAMGVVYRAEQDFPRREVALKVILRGVSERHASRRFSQEVASLSRMQHPGIVQIFDAGVEHALDGDHPYIAMELVRGEDLRSYCERRRLGIEARLQLMATICDSVEYAHQRGVIHRDLKPQNIIVADRPDGPQARVLDFGIARLMEPDTTDVSQSLNRGHLVGTLAYMSPEQAGGIARNCSDVCSLGCIAYELLAGRLPIDLRGLSLWDAVERLRNATPAPLGQHDRRLHGDIEIIVAKAIERDPDQRYPSAAALAEDIRRYLGKLPILARRSSLPYALRRYAQRHPGLMAGACLTILAVIAGLAGTTYGLLQAQQSRSELTRQLGQEIDSARFIADEVLSHLDGLVGTAEVRAQLLGHLQVQAEQLLVADPGNLTLRNTYAEILGYRGSLERDAGRRAEALAFREQALEIREQLVQADAANPVLRRKLAIIQIQVGDIAKETARIDEARRFYERALAIQQVLIEDTPANLGVLDDIAWSYARLADLAGVQFRFDEAAALVVQARQAIEQLSRAGAPEIAVLKCSDNLSATESHMALRQDDPRSFNASMIERLPTVRRLAQLQPDDRHNLEALANTLFIVAACHWDSAGAATEAEEAFAEFQDAIDHLTRLDPQDEFVLELRAKTYFLRARQLARRHEIDQALVNVRDGLEIWRALGQKTGRRVGIAKEIMCMVPIAVAANETDFMRALKIEAIATQEAACQSPLAQAQDFAELAALRADDEMGELRNLPGAVIAIDEALRRSNNQPARYWELRGHILELLGDPREARACYDQALARLDERDSRKRHALAVAMEDLGCGDHVESARTEPARD